MLVHFHQAFFFFFWLYALERVIQLKGNEKDSINSYVVFSTIIC